MSNFRMIDVSEKESTKRRAVACGKINMATTTIELIKSGKMQKGDVLKLAEIAGIMAAKNTSLMLPLCHPLAIESVKIESQILDQETVFVRCEVITTSKTGVEMEALCGVNASLLCIYDLAKAHDPVIRIGEIFLEKKEGGKSGEWVNPKFSAPENLKNNFEKVYVNQLFTNKSAAVLTISDRCSKGLATDSSGPALQKWLLNHQAEMRDQVSCVADEKSEIQKRVLFLTKELKVDLIITTGGTGISPRDLTPEAMQELNPKTISGFGEMLRQKGSFFTEGAWLSRSAAYVLDRTLIITLPGSLNACLQAMPELEKLVPHALKMIKGEGH